MEWSGTFFQKLIVAKLDKHFQHLYKNLTVITGNRRRLYLFKIRMSFHLRLGLPSCFSLHPFRQNVVYNFYSPHLSFYLACIILLDSYILTVFV